MHGARAGAPRGNRNALKHGFWSREAILARRRAIALLREGELSLRRLERPAETAPAAGDCKTDPLGRKSFNGSPMRENKGRAGNEGTAMRNFSLSAALFTAALATLAGCGPDGPGADPAKDRSETTLAAASMPTAAKSDGPVLRAAIEAYEEGDYEKALEAFSLLAGEGSAAAQFALGLMHERGHGTEQDYASAADWYERAAVQGYAGAQYKMGAFRYLGRGVAQDHAEAARWYRMAAEQGDVDAQADLGFLYDRGQGVPQDGGQAARWYRMAAEQGNVRAQANLGYLYEKGRGVEQDYLQAAEWYRMAAERGYPAAQNSLGTLYHRGWGIERDYAEAAKWYRRAAEQGHGAAAFNLGLLNEEGRGVPEDRAEAESWYRMAAEQGNVRAQYSLAYLKEHEPGTGRDLEEAALWYARAAEQGHREAPYSLGVLYMTADRHGGTADPKRAAMWLRIAAARMKRDDPRREEALARFDEVTAPMSVVDFAEADRMARNWLAAHPASGENET